MEMHSGWRVSLILEAEMHSVQGGVASPLLNKGVISEAPPRPLQSLALLPIEQREVGFGA